MTPVPHASVNAQVDAVFVLSVKSFRDRIAHIESELSQHGIAFEWIFEHDADELTAELIESTFAPSDMGPPQQSLVLKHIETWKRCVARGYRRVLVFEDDAMLASNFSHVFGAAMRAADEIEQPYMIYLGCGDNNYVRKYVRPAQRSESVLVRTDLALPATDATVLDKRAARLRLEYVAKHKLTRPADWLMREADAAMGVAHYWLGEPIVEQGSMNGRFASVLDRKRIGRGRAWTWLRFRWDRWRRRTFRVQRSEFIDDISVAPSKLRRDKWALAIARTAGALVAIGSFTGAAVANIAAGVMLLAFLTAPSCVQRIRRAWHQPLGRAALAFLAFLLLSTLWTTAPLGVALDAWTGWRHIFWLFIALALFDTRAAKLTFATMFVVVGSLAAIASFFALDFGAAQALSDVKGGIILRNHVTQGMALTSGALLALVLSLSARRSWAKWGWGAAAGAMVANVVFVAYARSGYLALAITLIVTAVCLYRGRARALVLGALALLMSGAILLSPAINARFERGLQEIREAHTSAVITPMGIRPVMWTTSIAIVREAPLMGHGVGSFPDEYRREVSRTQIGWRATLTADPHNQYLFILAETGLLGLLAFVWFLVSALRQPVTGPFKVIGIAVLLAWCVTSLFSSHFHTFNEGHLIAIMLGVCLARESVTRDHAPNAASTAIRTSS